jgi:hypothetical protein
MRLLKNILARIGWTGILIPAIFIILYVYKVIEKNNRIENAEYIKGVSLGIQKGVRGSLYLYYSFQLNGKIYSGSVTDDFCQKCVKCCQPGDTVLVRYRNGAPSNSDLVTKLPEGAHFEDEK